MTEFLQGIHRLLDLYFDALDLLTGQFWTTAGDEALLCLETFSRNGRSQELYPHASPASLLN
ncbi:MAG: hypothetical protein O2960_06835 [Verrucomicrobia bacterium]|nr:hypothetical protein [Verrucomicrobiota bacterium]